MKHYKNENNKVFAFESDEEMQMICQKKKWQKMVAISDDEKEILLEQAKPILTYAEKRKAEYPPIENYIDGIVKGDDKQVQSYINACKAVKEKYPKS